MQRPTLAVSALVLALGLLAAPLAAWAGEALVPAAKLFPMLDKYYATPPAERSKLALNYIVLRDGKPATGLTLALVAGGKRTPMPLSPSGKLERLPTAAELAGAQVAIDAPPGNFKLNVQLNLDTTIPPAPEISAAECAQAIDQVNAAIRRQAGLLALVAPRIKATSFPGAGSGVAVLADGKTVPLPLIKGAPAYDPAAIRNARTIRLAHTPSVVSLE
jgi:hypothetical protein